MFTDHEDVNPELFSEAKVLYLARTVNRDGTMNVSMMKWYGIRWNEMKWDEMRWNEMKWDEMR